MLNSIKDNTLIVFDILAVSIPRILIALIVAAIIMWACICMASQVFDALKNKTFELTKDWKVHFSNKPFRFCLLVFFYSVFFVVILYAGYCSVYDLITR